MSRARPGERLRDASLKSTTQFNTNPEYIRVGGPSLHERRLPHDQLLRRIHKANDGNPELHINKARHQETTGPAAETGSASYFQALKNASAWLPDPVEFLKFASDVRDWLTTFITHAETDREDPVEKGASSAPSIPGAKREAAFDANPRTPYQWYFLDRWVPTSLDMYSNRPHIQQRFTDPDSAITGIYDLENLLKSFFDDAPVACGLTRLVFETELHPDVFSYPVLVDDRLLPRAWRSFYAIHGRFHGITGHRGPVPVMVMPPLSCDPNRTASTASFNPASCEMFKEGDLVPQIDEFFSLNRTDKSVMGMGFVDPKTIVRWVHESAFLKPGQGQIAVAIVVFDEVFKPPIYAMPPIPQIDKKEPVSNGPDLIISLVIVFAVGMPAMACCAFAINRGAAKRCFRKIRSAD